MLRGVHVQDCVDDTLRMRCAAALLVLPQGAVFSHETAARLWGGVVPSRSRVQVTVPYARPIRRPELEARRARRMPPALRLRGLPVTGPERTFLDLATRLDLVDLVVLGDSLVRARRTTPELLVEQARQHRGPRAALARRAAALVRSGVDSPMETRLRLLVVLAGLPEPVVNHVLRDENGGWTYRFDLSWPQVKLALEYDGRQHSEDSRQWVRDVRRREDLDGRGWRLLVALSVDVFGTPGATVDRVAVALRQRGLVVRTSDGWRGHFPGRG
ncbi:hypothetical protein [Phycicoccus sp. Soil748]|uniref:hypothetical protein n=1 Tax=Phycicoccus sp. Soil748 TaxID=1736397 RepID=UPI000ACB3540|nr:hypothetical protein [Phycicoccus sp. Soil748]